MSDLIAYIDGGARGNPGPAAIGVIVRDEAGQVLYSAGKTIGKGTNNEAEYRALIHLLEMAAIDPTLRASKAESLRIHCDSQLIVMQVLGKWKIKEPRLKELNDQVHALKKKVPFQLRIKHVPREANRDADRLVNSALDGAGAAVSGAADGESF
ncbi:ribonuclease HI family protein [candidate division KSB1 bacterium]|nr:ribonuclease HI family protein [candidate division KSB1 bacterium]